MDDGTSAYIRATTGEWIDQATGEEIPLAEVLALLPPSTEVVIIPPDELDDYGE